MIVWAAFGLKNDQVYQKRKAHFFCIFKKCSSHFYQEFNYSKAVKHLLNYEIYEK